MSIGIRSLLLALSLSAGLSAPVFATPFIDVRSFWEVVVGDTGTPVSSDLMVTCGGTAGGFSGGGSSGCTDTLTVDRTVTTDETSSVSRSGSFTLTNTGTTFSGVFPFDIYVTPFDFGGSFDTVGLSIDNTNQSAGLFSSVSVFSTSPFTPGAGFDFSCSLPGVPGSQGPGDSYIFSPTTCGQRSPDLGGIGSSISLAPGESVTFFGSLTITDTFSGIPEPASLGLLLSSVTGLIVFRRRRPRQ
jgi:hypothetical protein